MFYERCKELSSTLTPAALGLPVDYSCPYKETIEKLNTMSQQNTPIGKLYCLQETIDNIQIDVKNHFKSSLRIGEPVPLPSDDLISLLATIIVQANLNFFPSDVYYIENFHWPFSEGEKLSFVLVTVRAALEFIKSADVDKYLPTKQKKKTSLPSRVTPPIHSSLAPPTVPPSLLKLHDEEEGKKEVPPLNETLEKLKRLRMIDDNIVTDRNNMSTKPEKQEGRSFFERLMYDDGVMSSVDFPSPSKS
ncbi:PREDICTED: ankyrin repeat domain-containing protein 27-like [Amphimedon queenslandica]|uniref:VPS9 domain-containing protein n=1 Tax=Amphimedon queenslandica TaxID=400682 RepID=A0A1X7SQK7_AMPQE|nr:PREDICTED: ankyrin repeat domain-containing protein 27-like [Amphimedon queenslandica]|eukprot:XP_019863088.1 PREDICTED: ankyrin repeat domain-containing protein 27-like [Amphimedon queenslandica]